MSVENLFEKASRQKFRFQTVKGFISTEDLWDLPLQSKNQFDLDNVAKAVNAELKSVTEESFVATTTNPAKDRLTTQLELVKYIISIKLQANEELKVAAVKSAERSKLIAILGEKQDAALKALSQEELAKKIAELA
jgi:hypothetical protein